MFQMSVLIQQGDCFFDENQLMRSHGFEHLDPIGQESFVNHIHFDGSDQANQAEALISTWQQQMKSKWPGKTFRIYVHKTLEETTVRFHLVRSGLANWCEGDVEGVSILIFKT